MWAYDDKRALLNVLNEAVYIQYLQLHERWCKV